MRRLAALAFVAVILIVLVVAQLVLPGIATQQLRDRLERSGRVLSVSVHAFPAIELLWHQADSVDVRLATYHSTPANLGTQLGQALDVGTLHASVDELNTGLITLRNATLSKNGSQLVGAAQVTDANLRSAFPILKSVTPVASAGGQLVLRGTFSVFGFNGAVDATVGARDGNLVVTPDLPIAPTITAFSDPHLSVESVSAAPSVGGFTVHATALLH
jgi:hypothetical protein